jgi:hypothetical protein
LNAVVVTLGGVVSGLVQSGLVAENVTEPTFVTARPIGELSVSKPPELELSRSNFVFATAVVGTDETVKFDV